MIRRKRGIRWHWGLALATLLALAFGLLWLSGGGAAAEAASGGFSQVSAGGDHSCALRTDGGVICWGSNYAGQAEAPSGRFSQVSAGEAHNCALRTDGGLACWGWNEDRTDGGAGGTLQPGQRRRAFILARFG